MGTTVATTSRRMRFRSFIPPVYLLPRWGAPKWPPIPPTLGAPPPKPWRASIPPPPAPPAKAVARPDPPNARRAPAKAVARPVPPTLVAPRARPRGRASARGEDARLDPPRHPDGQQTRHARQLVERLRRARPVAQHDRAIHPVEQAV